MKSMSEQETINVNFAFAVSIANSLKCTKYILNVPLNEFYLLSND
jgi:hypothetical protein